MGKVRQEIADDTASLAQWVFRKLRNHDPLSARDIPVRHKASRETQRQYQITSDSNTVRYCLNDGRVFEISVQLVEGALPAIVEGTSEPVQIAKGSLKKLRATA